MVAHCGVMKNQYPWIICWNLRSIKSWKKSLNTPKFEKKVVEKRSEEKNLKLAFTKWKKSSLVTGGKPCIYSLFAHLLAFLSNCLKILQINFKHILRIKHTTTVCQCCVDGISYMRYEEIEWNERISCLFRTFMKRHFTCGWNSAHNLHMKMQY